MKRALPLTILLFFFFLPPLKAALIDMLLVIVPVSLPNILLAGLGCGQQGGHITVPQVMTAACLVEHTNSSLNMLAWPAGGVLETVSFDFKDGPVLRVGHH